MARKASGKIPVRGMVRKPATPVTEPAFPIVGIGASAGGLETFTQLLEHLPATTGMAYVLIQHLDPTHASQFPEILSRKSKMPGAAGPRGNAGRSPDAEKLSADGDLNPIYSLGIALTEFLEENDASFGIQIFATDLSDPAIERARSGVYLENALGGVSAERL